MRATSHAWLTIRRTAADRSGFDWALALGIAFCLVCVPARGQIGVRAFPNPPRPVRFDRDVKPTLAHHCFKCHGNGRDKGGFRMDTREQILRGGDSGPAVQVGNAAQSRLIELVSGSDPKLFMPPRKDGNEPLDAGQIAVLREWIEEGLDWTDERVGKPYPLALRPITPPPGDGHPIDRLLALYFVGHEIVRAPPVEDRRFARRVYLDLVGLPPTAEELDAFCQDLRPGKRERLVRALLEDKEGFVGHWISFWMDHLRIGSAQAAGIFDNDESTKPRLWLEATLRSGAPYDRFVREFIAGISFVDYARSLAPSNEVASAQGRPEMQAAQVISQVFLGIRLQCASCHDSFVDRWTLREAWSLASALGGESFKMARCEIATGKRAEPGFLFPELGGIDAALPAPERRRRLAEVMTSPRNGLFARTVVNRVWARLFGRGLVEPLDEMVESEPWHPDLLDWLAGELIRQQFDLSRFLETIVTSRAYQLPAFVPGANRPSGSRLAEAGARPDTAPGPTNSSAFVFRGPLVRRLTAEQFVDALLRSGSFASDRSVRLPRRAWQEANDSLMKALGRPDRNTIVTTRPADSNALQALELMNGERLEALVTQTARAFLAHSRESQSSPVDQVFLQFLGRPPTDAEMRVLGQVAGVHPDEGSIADLLWVLLTLPEFQFIL